MVFSSPYFLFLYLPIVLLVYYLTPLKARNAVLLVFNLIFYAWGEPVYILIMFASIAIDYTHGMLVERCKRRGNDRAARRAVASSVIFNLALLFFFKYWDFVAGSLAAIGLPFMPRLGLSLPIGISFYTFQTMSYTIDVYRGDAGVQKNLINFGTFVTLFPQLIAGPIIKYKDLGDQIDHRPHSPEQFASGVQVFVVGLAKKVLLANNLGLLWDAYKALPAAELTTAGAWLGVAAFTFQLYFDFSGYSDMAVGLGRMLGFEFMRNFNYPYISRSITEFWRRWHISLSTWFRDYLYIPLGGSRVGRVRRYFNVMITFLLSGLWHGANWTYVIWGGLNGLFQIAGNVKNTLLSRLPATLKDGRPVVNRDCFSYRLFQRLMTFALICLTWVFFRAESLEAAMIVLRQMFSVHNPWIFFDETLYTLGLSRLELGLLVASAAVVLAVDVAHEHGATLRKRLERQNLAFRWLAYLAAILCILIFGVYGPGFDASQFIYFQF